MSYIRCLSNPEGLYIWNDGRYANILVGTDDVKIMPIELWEKLLKERSMWCGDVTLDMEIDSVKHSVVLTERVWPERSTHELLTAEEAEQGRLKVRITYNNSLKQSWELDGIWPVTMCYMASRFKNPYYGAGRFKSFLLRLLKVR